MQEAEKYGDIFILPSYDLDHYEKENGHMIIKETTSACTVKVLQAIEWATFCYQFDFVVRGADDAWLNAPMLLDRGLLPPQTSPAHLHRAPYTVSCY